MKKNDIKYFLAANSCEGFYSVFDKAYLPDGEWRAYIIKGGPGTGKSSFMKRFASYAEKKGCKALRCPCSSDPDSLDAVILPAYGGSVISRGVRKDTELRRILEGRRFLRKQP